MRFHSQRSPWGATTLAAPKHTPQGAFSSFQVTDAFPQAQPRRLRKPDPGHGPRVFSPTVGHVIRRGHCSKMQGTWLDNNNTALGSSFTIHNSLRPISYLAKVVTTPHFTDRDTETRRLHDFPKVTQLGSDNAISQLILSEMPAESFLGAAGGGWSGGQVPKSLPRLHSLWQGLPLTMLCRRRQRKSGTKLCPVS